MVSRALKKINDNVQHFNFSHSIFKNTWDTYELISKASTEATSAEDVQNTPLV